MISIYIIVDEQVARQRLGKHWFITEYIAAYRQGLYSTLCTGVQEYKVLLPTGLTANQGRRQPPYYHF
jgi:hypothetical protein